MDIMNTAVSTTGIVKSQTNYDERGTVEVRSDFRRDDEESYSH